MVLAGTRRWWALGAASLSVLAVSLDGTVLSVALPTLSGALNASETDLVWFSSGYLLVLAVAALPAGLIGDRFGRKRTALASLAAFGVGSVICAYAGSVGMFLAGRLLQGLAGAGVTVMALASLIVLFDEEERPRAVGVYQGANFLALPLGPILGGWLLAHFWWGWVFLINVPIVLLGLVAGALLLPESRASRRPGLDPVGTAAATLGLAAVVYGLIEAGEHGWGSAGIPLLAGLALLGAFVVWEHRVAEPLIDPRLFRSRTFAWGSTLSALAGVAMIGVLFTIPQYFQGVRGTDTLGAGLQLLPLVAGMVVGAGIAGRIGRWPRAAVAGGFLVLAAGLALGTATGTASGTSFVATWTALVGIGTGLTLGAATATALTDLSTERSGTESAVVGAFQKAAGPLGSAIMGSVLVAAYRTRLDGDAVTGLPATAAGAVRQSVYAGVRVADEVGSPALGDAVRAAFVHGMSTALAVSSGVAALGMVASMFVLPVTTRKLRTQPMPERPLGLRERKKAQTRATIQRHALNLFFEQGYHHTTIEQITTAAEVSETTFFRYFPTKEDVVLLDDFDPMIASTLATQSAELSPVAAARATFREHFASMTPEQTVETQQRLSLVIAEPALRAAMFDHFAQALQLIADVFADRSGRPRDDLKVRTIAGAVMGAMLAALASYAEDPSRNLVDLIDESLGHLEEGLTL